MKASLAGGNLIHNFEPQNNTVRARTRQGALSALTLRNTLAVFFPVVLCLVLLLAPAVKAEDNTLPALKGPINTGAASSLESLKPGPAGTTPLSERRPPTFAGSSPQKEVVQPPLQEVISRVELLVEPKDMVIKGKHGLKIQVKNNSDRALIFSGERATAKVGNTEFSSMDIQDFDELFAAPPTFASNWSIGARETIASALTFGAWQTAGDMFKNSAPGLKRYGKDEERREQDEERFGQRVLWPGESSSGMLLFRCEQSVAGAVVTLPVSSFFDSKEKSVVSSWPDRH